MSARKKRSRARLQPSRARAGERPGSPARAAKPAAPARRSLASRLLPLLLVAAGAWAYSTSFAGVLVLDDIRAIVQNPTIRSLDTAWSPPGAATVSGRPVANVTFALNYALAPPDARDVFAPDAPGAPASAREAFLRNIWGYHFFNLLIHLAAALALFGVVRRTLLSERLRPRLGSAAPYLAFAVALLWAVHPLQTESVTYVVQRVESLMGLFYLLTLYCAIRAAEGPRARLWAAGAVASAALGMATKEVMVTAPLIVALWDWTFGDHRERGPRWRLLAGLAATWIVLGALVYHERRAPSVALGGGIVWQYLVAQAGVVTHDLRLAGVPAPLVFLYTWPLAAPLGAVAPQAALVVALLVLTAVAVARRHPLGFAGAWFFLILAPTSTVLPIVTEVAAEHRMYLPLAAVIACAVVGVYLGGRALLERLAGETRARSRIGTVAAALAVAGLASVYGVQTRARNRDYWSDEGLWRDTVAKQPSNPRARVAYGSVLSTIGRLGEAEAELQAAVDLTEGDAIAQARLGAAQAAQGKFDAAIPHLERALALRPDDVDAHRWLGEAYAIRGQDALAVPHLERAVRAVGNDPALVARLAAILADSPDAAVRNVPRALALAERAVSLTSRRNPLALNILSVAQAASGRFAEAAATAGEALGLARARGDEALVSELERRVAVYHARATDRR